MAIELFISLIKDSYVDFSPPSSSAKFWLLKLKLLPDLINDSRFNLSFSFFK